MARDTRSSAEIERDIEREREGLERDLDELRAGLSPGALFDQVSRVFQKEGGEIGRSVSTSVKRNPIGLIVTAAGIGLLALPGRDWRAYGRRRARQGEHVPDLNTHELPERGARDVPGDELDVPEPYAGPRSRVPGLAQQPRASWEPMPVYEEEILVDPVAREPVEPEPVESEPDEAGAASKGRMSRIRSDLRERRAAQRARAQRMRARLSHGTERLSEEGRNRVISARHRAELAQRRANKVARRGGQDAAAFYEAHPVVTGALVLAAGAAFGGLLPGTRREDARLGATRDRLFDEAERIFEEERVKIGAVATAAGEEVAAEVDRSTPEGTHAVDAAEERVRSAAKRVADRAESEAENQNLGHTRKP